MSTQYNRLSVIDVSTIDFPTRIFSPYYVIWDDVACTAALSDWLLESRNMLRNAYFHYGLLCNTITCCATNPATVLHVDISTVRHYGIYNCSLSASTVWFAGEHIGANYCDTTICTAPQSCGADSNWITSSLFLHLAPRSGNGSSRVLTSLPPSHVLGR